MLGNTKGKQLYNYTPDYVLFDLETTGISRNTDEVIEISAVKVRNGRVVDEFSIWLIRVNRFRMRQVW